MPSMWPPNGRRFRNGLAGSASARARDRRADCAAVWVCWMLVRSATSRQRADDRVRDSARCRHSWNSSGPTATGFPPRHQVERTTGMDPPSAPFAVVSTPPPNQPHRFVDSAPTGGTKFSYRVRTIITSDGETTALSDPAPVETWRRAFTSPLQQGGVNESVAGHCIVQRVSPGSLTHPGNLILLSIRGASDAELTLSRVTISNAAPSGDDFDSAAPPVDLTTSPVTVTAGLSLPLQPVAFNVDVDEPAARCLRRRHRW